MKYLDSFCAEFGFSGFSDFITSLIHVKLLAFTIPVAAIVATMENYMGLRAASLGALVALITLELVTGLAAAKNNGVRIESRKFSRFGLKLLAWGCLIFVFQSLYIDIIQRKPVQAALYSWAHSLIVFFIVMEYSISVLENISKLSGGKYSGLTEALRRKLDNILNGDKPQGNE